MNWGKNFTLLGAMRLSGWVQLNTMFESTNKDRFIAWLVTKLLPRLRRGDILLMDNLGAHKGRASISGARNSECGSSTCRPIRTTSIPSSRVGRCKSSTFASTHRERRRSWFGSLTARGVE